MVETGGFIAIEAPVGVEGRRDHIALPQEDLVRGGAIALRGDGELVVYIVEQIQVVVPDVLHCRSFETVGKAVYL